MYENTAPTVAMIAVITASWPAMLLGSWWAACSSSWSCGQGAEARGQRIPGLAAHDPRAVHGHGAEMFLVVALVPEQLAAGADTVVAGHGGDQGGGGAAHAADCGSPFRPAEPLPSCAE